MKKSNLIKIRVDFDLAHVWSAQIILFLLFIFPEGDKVKSNEKNDTVVNVPQIFDEEFSTFFGRVDNLPSAENVGDLTTDFGDLKIESPRLL